MEMEQDKEPTVLDLQKELGEFKKEQRKDTNRILEVLEGLSGEEVKRTTPKEVAIEEDEDTFAQEFPVSKAHQAIFERYFDPEDGFVFATEYPERNRVTVFVPKELSNASDAHWHTYKSDVRSSGKLLEDFDEQLDQWLEKVAKNLRYNKNLVRK